MPARHRRGYTLIEILMVVVIVGLLSIVAYPSLSSFAGRNNDVSAASGFAHLVNRTKSQARKQSRAYLIRLSEFSADEPLGLVHIERTTKTSCGRIEGVGQVVKRVPYGGTPTNDYGGDKQIHVGLLGWQIDNEEAPSTDTLVLCISPSGALHHVVGNLPLPIAGTLDVLIQRFSPSDGAFDAIGPPRVVNLTYANGAHLELK